MNEKIVKIFRETAELLDIKGGNDKSLIYRKTNYQKAAKMLENLGTDIAVIYKKSGIAGIKKELKIGDKIAKKIEEYLKKKKIHDFEKLKQDTAIQQIITHFFKSKGVSLEELKKNAFKKKIVYSRYTRPAKDLIKLAGSVEKGKEAITKVAQWAQSRNLDYTIETVFKKWLEIDHLKPKEIVKKPFFQGNPMVWSQTKNKWYVIAEDGEWREFAGEEKEIEWRIK